MRTESRISRHINVCKLTGLHVSICQKPAVGDRFNLRSKIHNSFTVFTKGIQNENFLQFP
jgi:hypothetical protein